MLKTWIIRRLSIYLSRVQGESKDKEKELGCLKIKLNDAEDLNNKKTISLKQAEMELKGKTI